MNRPLVPGSLAGRASLPGAATRPGRPSAANVPVAAAAGAVQIGV